MENKEGQDNSTARISDWRRAVLRRGLNPCCPEDYPFAKTPIRTLHKELGRHRFMQNLDKRAETVSDQPTKKPK